MGGLFVDLVKGPEFEEPGLVPSSLHLQEFVLDRIMGLVLEPRNVSIDEFDDLGVLLYEVYILLVFEVEVDGLEENDPVEPHDLFGYRGLEPDDIQILAVFLVELFDLLLELFRVQILAK